MPTWSNTITGSSEANRFDDQLIIITLKNKERKCYPEGVPTKVMRELIEENFGELIEFTYKQNSRLAFQVLGIFLMRYGAKMPEGIKKDILKYSRWEDEEDQLLNPLDKEDRFLYLTDFRDKIKNYIEVFNKILGNSKQTN